MLFEMQFWDAGAVGDGHWEGLANLPNLKVGIKPKLNQKREKNGRANKGVADPAKPHTCNHA